MGIWETLGEVIGRAFKSITDSMIGLLKFKAEQLEDVNKEIAGASLDPEKFKTQEVKDLARAIKDKLKTSPTGPADWIQGILGDFMTKIWDVAIGIMIPSKMETFEDAKASATWLTSLVADFVVLSAALDIAGTAFSATLVRNLIHIFRLFAATFGMDRYMSAVIAPALGASIVPRLEQGYNAQYQTLIPGTSDIIRMAVREAFSPEIAEKFGQYEDFPEAIVPWLAKSGLSEEWATRHWAAHWGLPSSSDGFELLHRGIIDEETLKLLLRANDIMPYWRDQLIKLSWNIPTRVDVRRFWDMRTIDEARLREIYTGLGYHGRDLEDYVLWTKIFVDFPDLLARYKNGWITLDQVKSELVAMGMKPERADTMIEEKIKKAAPERTVSEKNITKADIFKGVKQARITREEGLELLQDIGYDPDEATYLLDINIPSDQVDTVVEERQLTKADILTGLKTAVITRDEAKSKLVELRYSLANVELLLKIFDAQVTPPKEIKLKEASKADIVLGVKKGLITQEEGYMMLLDIDFSPEAALFILSVATEESPFSSINFAEFKDMTQKYRRAAGMEGKPMTEEIKTAGAKVVRLTGEVESLQRSIRDEERKLIGQEILPAEATARLTELRASLHHAESELARVKTDYNIKLAEWRHAIK